MILKLYVIRDEVACDNHVLLYSQNDTLFKRDLKALLLAREANYINTNTKDKRAFLAGELDTNTGVIKALDPIIPVCTLEEVRLDLVDEINIAKAQAAASKAKAAAAAGVPVEALDNSEEVQKDA